MNYQVSINDFEGPMDLLLHLVKEMKMDIYEIDTKYIIDKYLDDCYLAKLNTVRIVHGKGTGKLREGIHLFLRRHSHVKSFRLGTFGEGEMGVTVVDLK